MKKVKKIAPEQLEIAKAAFNMFYAEKGWTPFAFQREVFDCFFAGFNVINLHFNLTLLLHDINQPFSGWMPAQHRITKIRDTV